MNIERHEIKKVVVRAPNWVGDALMCLPALRALRRLLPHAKITLVSRPGAADIFREADCADEVLVYERRGLASAWIQSQEWRRRQFDLAVLFQNAFEAAAIAFMARVPTRIGYDTERRGFLLTYPIATPAWKNERHEVFYYLNLISELERALSRTAPAEPGEPEIALHVPDERKRKARELLQRHGLATAKPLILLCPGSVNSRAKRWPSERYAALADQFIETGATVAVIGSPGERDVSAKVCAQARHRPVMLTGETSVAEVTALIAIADLLVTNDTGPAHIGPAVGTPTIVIFGPTNPVTTRPFGPLGVVIRHPPDCAPCMLRDCPIDHRCMTAITPGEIFERASELLRQRVQVTA
ncbi:MAG TPA: lipopolysaccharide heptosyltransferase II [Pyrinomonadaceae bacterium]